LCQWSEGGTGEWPGDALSKTKGVRQGLWLSGSVVAFAGKKNGFQFSKLFQEVVGRG
jgi:hypothetical protein